MDLGVVPLEDRPRHPLQVFLGPVDLEPAGDRVHEPLVALEDLQGAGDAAHGQERGVGAAKRGVGIGQALPVGEAPVRVTRRALKAVPQMAMALRGPRRVQPERLGDARGDRVGALRGVVETFGPHGRHVAQAALHLVGHGQRGQEIPAAAPAYSAAASTAPRLSLGWQVSPLAR